MKTHVCNIMQNGNKAFLLHLACPDHILDFIAHGYSFRGHQLKIDPIKSIVVLDRVPYGLPNKAITTAIARHGTVSALKAITHKGYGVSKYRLEIELRQDIPSRITIQGNPINVFYKNQPRSCFARREAGHEAQHSNHVQVRPQNCPILLYLPPRGRHPARLRVGGQNPRSTSPRLLSTWVITYMVVDAKRPTPLCPPQVARKSPPLSTSQPP